MNRAIIIIVLLFVVASFAPAEWAYQEQENLMEGTTSRMAFLVAEAYQGTLRAPILIIRARGDEYEVYIHWGGYNMDRDLSGVYYRIDDEPRLRWRAALSTTREATFFRQWQEVISKLLDHDGSKLVVQADRATDVVSVALFDLTGIAEANRIIDGTE